MVVMLFLLCSVHQFIVVLGPSHFYFPHPIPHQIIPVLFLLLSFLIAPAPQPPSNSHNTYHFSLFLL